MYREPVCAYRTLDEQHRDKHPILPKRTRSPHINNSTSPNRSTDGDQRERQRETTNKQNKVCEQKAEKIKPTGQGGLTTQYPI